MEAISASRPHEMKSSTSQRAGSSRTFLNTMYLTSGANVITRRLRTWRSPVVLYWRHSASVSAGGKSGGVGVGAGCIGHARRSRHPPSEVIDPSDERPPLLVARPGTWLQRVRMGP